jgi:hypothetical protein
VSRKQSWKRRSGERVENSYRYYQCESRTNQSVCNYHTRRADALEHEVQQALAASVAQASAEATLPTAAAVALAEADRVRLAARLRALDKRIGKYVESAARGALSKDKMVKLSVKAAADRLAIEDAMEAAERRADGAGGAAATPGTAQRLASSWDVMAFSERQGALREAVSRITVSDDKVQLDLR